MARAEEGLLEPVRRSRIYEGIVEQIQALITDGKLRPGDQLPPERVLAETFKVSRTSLREALRALELGGLIEGRQGGGTFVRAPSANDLVQPFASALLAGRTELANVLEVREIVEPALSRLAALRATAEQILELERLIQLQEQKVARQEPFPELDELFHETIARAADNPIVMRLLTVVLDLLQESRASHFQGGDRPARSLDGHRRILEAIRRGDGEAAYAATLDHISQVRERLVNGAR